jgi:hypothetical protein
MIRLATGCVSRPRDGHYTARLPFKTTNNYVYPMCSTECRAKTHARWGLKAEQRCGVKAVKKVELWFTEGGSFVPRMKAPYLPTLNFCYGCYSTVCTTEYRLQNRFPLFRVHTQFCTVELHKPCRSWQTPSLNQPRTCKKPRALQQVSSQLKCKAVAY